MAMENKRIIQLNTERTTPTSGDYVMVDSATDGTAKYQLSKITDGLTQEIATRTAADTAINTEVTQLKEDLNAYNYTNTVTCTKSDASGVNVFVLDNPIPSNLEISITNDTTDSTYKIMLIDVDRGLHNLGNSASGDTKTATIDKQVVEFRAEMVEGTNINSALTYGENLVERVGQCEILSADTASLLHAYNYTDSETFTKSSATGTTVYVLEHAILPELEISISNDTQDSSYTIVLVDIDRGVHNLGVSTPGNVRKATLSKKVVEIRFLMVEGSDINSTVTYGNNLLDRMDAAEEDINKLQVTDAINCDIAMPEWENRQYIPSNGTWSNSDGRISSAIVIPTSKIKVFCTSGYKYGVIRWSSTDRVSTNFIGDTGFLSGDIKTTVEAGEIVHFILAHTDDSNISVSEGNNIRIIPVSEPSYSYTAQGERVSFSIPKYTVSEISKLRSTPASTITPSVTEVQGNAFYNNKIFQLYSNDVLIIIDYMTNAKTQLSITSGHGNTCSFSDEFYDASDDFPLLYVSAGLADTSIATVYVNRVSTSATELVRTLVFPVNKTGYHANLVLDNFNHVLYQVGYRQNSFNVATDNALIISKWNLDDLTDNGDNTYTPAYVSSFELPYYTTMQGMTFHDRKIIAISSGWTDIHTKLIFIDVDKQTITSVMDSFPAEIQGVETEGIALVPEDNKYFILIKTANVFFYRVDVS